VTQAAAAAAQPSGRWDAEARAAAWAPVSPRAERKEDASDAGTCRTMDPVPVAWVQVGLVQGPVVALVLVWAAVAAVAVVSMAAAVVRMLAAAVVAAAAAAVVAAAVLVEVAAVAAAAAVAATKGLAALALDACVAPAKAAVAALDAIRWEGLGAIRRCGAETPTTAFRVNPLRRLQVTQAAVLAEHSEDATSQAAASKAWVALATSKAAKGLVKGKDAVEAAALCKTRCG